MKIFYILVVIAVLFWKAYYVLLRAVNTYDKDRREHDSLREYLLGNGATQRESLRPFFRHALVRAYAPLLSQWRLFAGLVVLAILTGLVADGFNIFLALLLLLIGLVFVTFATLLVIIGYVFIVKK